MKRWEDELPRGFSVRDRRGFAFGSAWGRARVLRWLRYRTCKRKDTRTGVIVAAFQERACGPPGLFFDVERGERFRDGTAAGGKRQKAQASGGSKARRCAVHVFEVSWPGHLSGGGMCFFFFFSIPRDRRRCVRQPGQVAAATATTERQKIAKGADSPGLLPRRGRFGAEVRCKIRKEAKRRRARSGNSSFAAVGIFISVVYGVHALSTRKTFEGRGDSMAWLAVT